MAGLAGALEVAGPVGQLTPHVALGYGFAAIIVAFVGRLSPVGVVFSSLLMSMFYIGGELAQSRMGLPKSLTLVFQGVLLFALLASDTLIHSRLRWVARRSAVPGSSAVPTAPPWGSTPAGPSGAVVTAPNKATEAPPAAGEPGGY
jgi:simple sugar transport system permease protein